MRAKDIAEIAEMTPAEKILLVEDLWDEIAHDESAIKVPQSHKDELDRRLKAQAGAPGRLLSLEELQSRVEARK